MPKSILSQRPTSGSNKHNFIHQRKLAHQPHLAFILQLLHEMITEGISGSSRGQKRARTANSDSTSTDEDNNNIILHRFTSLVELVEQSKEENGTGK